jgi:putative nucleotidyltransferase with HDIG domain
MKDKNTDYKLSQEDYNELLEIYAETTTNLKKREQNFLRSRDAFLNMLEDISASYKDLEGLFLHLVIALVKAIDAKSSWTKGHSENVAKYAEQIAGELGFSGDKIKNLRLAGLLHDVGKIGTYDYVLDKPSKLTKEEYEVVKKHPVLGTKILEGIKQLKNIIPIIRYHHERIDGKGYPDGLKGEEIPLGAKILHVADSFDSMTEDRPYRPNPGIDYAISELKKYSGIQFDPQVVDAFLRVLKDGRKTFS